MAAMKANLGEFEQMVLLALARLDENGYGMSVRDEIETQTERDVSLGAVYKALWRLERKGLLVSRVGEPAPERGGRRKRLYRLSPTGRKALQESVDALRRMSRGLGKGLVFP